MKCCWGLGMFPQFNGSRAVSKLQWSMVKCIMATRRPEKNGSVSKSDAATGYSGFPPFAPQSGEIPVAAI